MKKQILKVLVGSRAHGLNNKNSDFDYRGVFVSSTREVLSIGGLSEQTSWIEGKIDDTSWEIGKFLQMAIKCNPTVLEVFLAKDIESNFEGQELQKLFKYVWNSKDVLNAFVGYGLNQRKKFLDDKDGHKNKFAVAYLRTLYQGWELLSTQKKFSVSMKNTPIFNDLKRYKAGEYRIAEVIEQAIFLENRIKEAYAKNPKKRTSFDKVNEFLLEIRRNNW